MGYRYVILTSRPGGGMSTVLTGADVTGTEVELTERLRAWALSYLNTGLHQDGRYTACLVETDGDGYYDTGLSIAMEDVLWFWDEECVPVSSVSRS